MPGKWSVKNPLTLEERKAIQELINAQPDLSGRDIALFIKRGKSTIMRELKRLGNEKYNADKAQQHFENLQLETRKNAKKRRKRNK
jgi:IS30 family transposase